MAMFRRQACSTFALLLLLALESESFTATRSITSHNSLQQPSVSLHTSNTRRKRPREEVPAFLYSAQFQADSNTNHGSSSNINNRHSANDYWYNLKSLPQSKVLREIRNPLLAVLGWSSVVSLVHATLARTGRAALASSMCMPSTAHSFLVSSLGLLLVFRTNSAYQRFNEGRKIWEQILSVSRNLSRLTSLYSREIGPSRRHRLRNLIAAFPYLLRHHIRTGCLCEKDEVDPQHRLLLQEPALQRVETRHEGDQTCGGTTLTDTATPTQPCWVDKRNLPWSLLTPGALDKIARVRNRPLWICDRLAREICDIPYDGVQFTNRERQHFLSQVEKLTDSIGKCERIHQTAVPLNYARHSLRTLTLWLFTLPFTMIKDFGLLTPVACAVIAWLLFGIYQIGYSIEDPFQGTLRLSILCDAIKSDVLGTDDDDYDDYDMDEAAAPSLLEEGPIPAILTQTLELQQLPPTPSPLFSMADYQMLEQ